MAKAEFLFSLSKKLQVLNEKERDDILSEYSQHIDMCTQGGLTEDDAIKDFGDINELAAEILEAYNLDPNFNKSRIDSEEITQKVNGIFATIGNVLNNICARIKDFLSNTSSIKLSFLIKFVLTLFAIMLVYFFSANIVFVIADAFYDFLPPFFDHLISIAFIIVFHLIFAVLAIAVLYNYAKTSKKQTPQEPYVKEDVADDISDKKFPLPLPGIKKTNKERTSTVKGDVKHMVSDASKAVSNGVALIIKLIILCFLAPIILCLGMVVIGLGLLVVLCFLGYPLIGITLCTLGFTVCSVVFVWFIWDLLIKNKEADKQ